MTVHHEHDHRCSEVVAADQASTRRRGSVSSLVARLNSPTSPTARRQSSWNFGKEEAGINGLQTHTGQRRATLETGSVLESPAESPTLLARSGTDTSPPADSPKVSPPILYPPHRKELEDIPLERKTTWTQAEQEAGDGFVPKCKWYFRTFTWGRWAAEDVSSIGLVPALVIQALATG